jgi:hypothetical protein
MWAGLAIVADGIEGEPAVDFEWAHNGKAEQEDE